MNKKIGRLLLLALVLLCLAFALGGCSVRRVSYEEFAAMSGDEQKAYYDTFSSIEEFFAWYNEAKAAYEAAHPDSALGDGGIVLGDGIG